MNPFSLPSVVLFLAAVHAGSATLDNENWDPAFGDPGFQVAFGGAEEAASGPSAMAVDASGNVYCAGGVWNRLDGVPYDTLPNYAKWDRATGQWTTFGNNAGAAGVFEMAVRGNDVYAGGQWSLFVDGSPFLQTQGVVKWDGAAWSGLGEGLSAGMFGLPASVEAMVFDTAGNLYVGGLFGKAGTVSARNVAKWDGSAWSALGGGLESRVSTMAIGPDGTLYAGGVFNEGLLRRVGRWDGSQWQPMGAGFTSGEVAAFAFDEEGHVYAGGSFQFITDPKLGPNFTPASRVARWNGVAWSPLGPGVNAMVRTMAFKKGVLFAGGQFTATGDGATPLNQVAAWNGAEWQALGAGTSHADGPSSAPVFHMLVSSSASDPSNQDLIVGGPFDHAGGNPANNIALWNIGGIAVPPAGPSLQLVKSGDGAFDLVFNSADGVTYNVLFTPSLSVAFTNVQSLDGTGGTLTVPLASLDPNQGFYRLSADTN